MKVIILAGGFGTRLSEHTEVIPKPMITIGNRPIIWHIMQSYASFGYKDFYLALGYKAEVVKEYFMNYHSLNADFSVNLKSGIIQPHNIEENDWNVTLVNTGLNSMTGGRLKRMKDYVNNQTFMLTYGDGVSNIDIDSLVKFHKSHGKMVTISAVHPIARFGEIAIDGNKVVSFKEKPQTTKSWINGGYFVIEPEFYEFINNDNTILEREPLEKLALMGELMAFHHDGYWQCMDTKRDKDNLEELWASGQAPWKV